MAAVAANPTSGTHLSTVFDVSCSAIAANDTRAWDAALYPSEPQITYYFKFSLSGQDSLKSPVFSTNSEALAEWHGVILPAAGSWTLGVYGAADDGTIATATVVVA
jgi:hypothetical protein